MHKSTLTSLPVFCSILCIVNGKSIISKDFSCYITIEEVRTVIPKIPYTEEQCKSDIHVSGIYHCKDQLYIKPECTCSYWWFNRKNICNKSLNDITCRQCVEFSLNKNGPCLNGGKPDCTIHGDQDILASDMVCRCPEGFKGKFCEEKMEQKYQICEFAQITEKEALNATECSDGSSRPCLITSKHNQTFACEDNTLSDPSRMYACEDVPYIISTDKSSHDRSQQQKPDSTVNFSSHLEALHVLKYMVFLTCLKYL